MGTDRRQFLRLGGASLVSALVFGACSDDTDPSADGDGSGAESATSPAPTTTALAGPVIIDDLSLARTAASLEALAIAVYGTAASSGVVTDKGILELASVFGEHHQEHLDAINDVVVDWGGNTVTTPNAALQRLLIDPVLTNPNIAQPDVARLVYDLERIMAQTYTFAAGAFSLPALRSTGMTVGGTEARHAAVIGLVGLKLSPADLFPASFAEANNPLPSGALVAG